MYSPAPPILVAYSDGVQLPKASQRVVEAAGERGLAIEVRHFPAGTKTAAAAAAAVGCPVGAIVKSLVFVVDERPVVALVPGDKRLDTSKLARVAGGRAARRASLEEVRTATGYAAGGTPPFGYASAVEVFADRGLRRYSTLWAAAGTPTTVFPIACEALAAASAAEWADLAE